MKELIFKQDAINQIMSVPDGNWKSERYAKEIEKIPAEMFGSSEQLKLSDAVQIIMDFLDTCSGGTASIKTPDGVELNTDWGYVYEGLDLLKEYAERKEKER